MKHSLLASFLVTPLLLVACGPQQPGNGNSSAASSQVASMSQHPDIQVDAPAANAVVQSPLVVTGRARGTWYFEASFPVRLLDSAGNELAVSPAEAQSDWMTTDFVPFQTTLVFTTTSQTGSLVLEKDNPSGEPQNAASVVIPVDFVP
jgi:hypothetical protein